MKKSGVLNSYDETTSTKKGIKKLTKPIFDKVLQEGFSDSMAIVQKPKKRLWRPNNYRRQIKVKPRLDSTFTAIHGVLGDVCTEGKRNKLIFVRNYDNILIQYGKNTLTGIYSQNIVGGEKEVFLVEGNTNEEIETWIKTKKDEIKSAIDNALYDFSRKFSLLIPFATAIWSRHEDWTSDKEIQKIPKETIVHIENFKKVYPEGVEYTGGLHDEPTAQLINRVRNDGLRDLTPILNTRLDEVSSLIKSYMGYAYVKSRLNVLNDVFVLENEIKGLLPDERLELGQWLFEKFGGIELK